jgi:branched-chain amino acid transport system substrate-binding protein
MHHRHHARRPACRWAAALTAASLAFACADDPPPTVVIGFASNMGSPSAADVGQAALSASHRPGGPTIIVLASDQAPPPVAGRLLGEVDRALRYARDPAVVALVGPGGSREALQTAPVYRDAGLANVIPTATSKLLRDLGPLSFLLAPNDSIQGEFIGRFVAERLRAKVAAIMYVPDEYGVGLAAGSAVAMGNRGVKITARLPVRPNQLCQPHVPRNSYDDVVADVFAYGVPDVIVLATRTRESACIARSVQRRAPVTRFVAGDGAVVQHAFLELVGAAADSMYFVAFWHHDRPDSASRAFVAQFRAIVKREPRHDDAMFYDAVMLVGQAIRNGGASRAAVAEYLSQLGRERPPYRGVTGPIAFTPGAPRPLLMTRLRDGHPEPVPTR